MYGGNRQFNRLTPPVKKGDEIEVTIEAVGAKGDGIAKVKGFILFVPNTKQGETVTVRITNVLRKVGFAEVVGKGSGKSEAEPSESEGGAEGEESYEDEGSEESGEEETKDSEDTEESTDDGNSEDF